MNETNIFIMLQLYLNIPSVSITTILVRLFHCHEIQISTTPSHINYAIIQDIQLS